MLQLRYYQKDTFNALMTYIENNPYKYPVVVLPTGSGKTVLIALLVEELLRNNNTRVLLLSHQQELLKQGANEIYDYFDGNVDIGIYSAGLNCKDFKNRVIVAGIQSVYRKSWTHIGHRDLIIIDEVHLVNHQKAGMYRKFLDEMIKINPHIVIIGLTATAYRTGSGIITEGEEVIFDDICYEVTIPELIDPFHYRNKDKKQYLCNLITKSAVNKVDLSNVHIRGGEYVPGEMEQAFLDNDLVCRAVKEIKQYTQERKKVLVFCAGIRHCEEVTRKMIEMGMNAKSVHSKQSTDINTQNIQDFKDGKIKYLNNINVLSVGFNEKAIDCIVMLRSTCSPGLWYQAVGRGLRMHPDKENCLVLDMGKNAERHGPIDKIEIRKTKTGTEVGTMPMKECPECQALLFLAVMECPECGYIFPAKDKHEDEASTASILSEWKKPVTYNVSYVYYHRHTKKGKPDSMRVEYLITQYQKFTAYICLDHDGYARTKAKQWIKAMTDKQIDSVDDALTYCKTFKIPEKIIVDENGKFPNIIGYLFPEPVKEEKKTEQSEQSDEQFRKELEELIF